MDSGRFEGKHGDVSVACSPRVLGVPEVDADRGSEGMVTFAVEQFAGDDADLAAMVADRCLWVGPQVEHPCRRVLLAPARADDGNDVVEGNRDERRCPFGTGPCAFARQFDEGQLRSHFRHRESSSADAAGQLIEMMQRLRKQPGPRPRLCDGSNALCQEIRLTHRQSEVSYERHLRKVPARCGPGAATNRHERPHHYRLNGRSSRQMTKQRLSTAWWAALVLTEFVILWGAIVRATGSGAGCGAHWPTCKGEILPLGGSTETLIEFTHRLTSGLALLVVVGLWWVGRRALDGLAARAARWAVVFMVLEAIIGAGLVLFEWTGTNASGARALAIAVHLSNTLLLLGSMALAAHFADKPTRLERFSPPGLMRVALFAILGVAAAGAVTALGDTLFPVESLTEGLRQDLSATSSFLVNLRVVHPIIAIAAAAYVVWVAQKLRDAAPALATGVLVVVGAQILAGFVNLALLAPVWMQVVHLLLADVLWVLLVLFAVSVKTHREAELVAV